ncbi:glycosyltransferase [Kosakonia sp. ML.JS2a]|uniref:glycosyltransferase family 2 protein n=1 Tax=Kosakonia sp. ML.JS2a TaxID=2980557 RepID=UPI0021D860DD|nr:glycosyltransferase [Kosakonia sp. ML.JS2a]UXY08773.1 glycosyltransferase [Kosakonia sp. ML.JS2a]
MHIDVVVPIFNQMEKTILFINSLTGQIANRLIIIDNGSDETMRRYLRNLDATLITNESNLGYTTGMNQGLSRVENEFVLFANNDVILPANVLQRMLAHLNTYDIVAPLTNRAFASTDCTNPLLVDFDSLTSDIEQFSAELYEKNKHRSQPIASAYGHCLLMKRDVLDRVGLLDESFDSGYYTDDDFCRRAIQLQMKIGLALDCFVFHFCHTTLRAMGIDPHAEIEKARRVFEDKCQ